MLKTKKNAAYTTPNRITFFIVYELDSWPWDLNSDFTWGGCLFNKLAKSADLDKYAYSSYGTRFDTHIKYSLPDGSVSKNVINFGADMSSSMNIDNKGKGMLILDKGITQGLNNTLVIETQYSIAFTRPGIKICFKAALQWEQQFLIC